MTQNNEQVFALVYEQTDASLNDGVSKLTVEQNCVANQWNPTTGELSSSDSGVEFTTTQSSALACPLFTANALIQFIDEYKWIFGIVFIVVGLFFAFFGFKLFQIALFIVGTVVVSFLILFIFYATFLKENTKEWVGWTVFACSILLGLLAGFLLVKLEKFAGAILAGWGGFLLGVLLCETVLYFAKSAVLFWVVNVAFAIIFAALGFFMFDHAVMISTAFIGSYMTMKGIGIMAGGFPNIYVLIEMIENNAINTIPGVFYAYLAGIIILTVICTVIQYKFFLKKKQQDEVHPYNKLN